MAARKLLFRAAAREALLRGAAEVADAVRVTLGPKALLRNKRFILRVDLVVPFAVKVISQETNLGHVGV